MCMQCMHADILNLICVFFLIPTYTELVQLQVRVSPHQLIPGMIICSTTKKNI